MSELSARGFLAESDADAIASAESVLLGGRANELADVVLEQLSDENSWRRDLILRRLGRLAGSEALLPALTSALRDGEHPERRNAARSALAALASPESPASDVAITTLGEIVEASADVDARLLAAITLGESGNARARSALEAALADTDPNVSAGAAEGLGLLGDRRAVQALTDSLTGADVWTRTAAILALGRLGDARAYPALASALGDPTTAPAAATAIGEIGDSTGVGLLRAALDSNSTDEARACARSAIAEIYGRNPESDVPDWLRAAVERDVHLSKERFEEEHDPRAARLLGIAGTEEAADCLLDALASVDLRPVAAAGLELLPADLFGRMALERLDRVGSGAEAVILDLLPTLTDRDHVERVAQRLGSDDTETRAAAAAALGRSDPALVRASISRALRDPRRRAGAALAYGRLETDGGTTLIGLLEDDEPTIRSSAAAALGRCGASAGPAIQSALERERDDGVRGALIAALGEVGGESAVPQLVEALRDPDPGIRFVAATALGRTGAKAALEPLFSAVRDPLPEVRIAALHALGLLSDSRASRVVASHLTDDSREIRRTAAHALEDLNDPTALRSLTAALADSDREVRFTAIDTLRKLGGAASIRALESRADVEPDPSVRNALTRVILDLRDAMGSTPL